MEEKRKDSGEKKKGLFSRLKNRTKREEFDETKDIYYGLKLGQNNEKIQKIYEETGEDPRTSYGSYDALFSGKENEDEEDAALARQFARLHEERRRRMEKAAKESGTNLDKVAKEYGVVAPMPITAYSGDPYANQYGLEEESAKGDAQSSEDGFVNAMMEETMQRTQEINTKILASHADETAAHTEAPADSDAKSPEEETYHIDESIFDTSAQTSAAAEPTDKPEKTASAEADETPGTDETESHGSLFSRLLHSFRNTAEKEPAEKEPMEEESEAPAPVAKPEPVLQAETVSEPEATSKEPHDSTPKQPTRLQQEISGLRPNVIYPSQTDLPWIHTSEDGLEKKADVGAYFATRRPIDSDVIATPEDAAEFRRKMYPQDEDSASTKEIDAAAVLPDEEPATEEESAPATPTITHESNTETDYAPNNLPMHMLKADLLQSAVFSEARLYEKPAASESEHGAGSVQKTLRETPEIPAADIPEEEPENEYNHPEDARVVARQLKEQMHEYSVRSLVALLCTGLALLMTLVCEGTKLLATDVLPTKGYLLGCLLVLVVTGAANYKTIFNGLGQLRKLHYNADTAVSFAMIGGLIQAVASLFFAESVKQGQLHMYTSVVCLAMLLNTLGKLVMSRRIFSNFRFVSSNDTKYAVKVFDDSGMAARMTEGVLSGQPVIGYVRPTAFMSDYMDISYAPDRSEEISATIAPVGILASIALFITAFFLKSGVAGALCALTASLCAFVPFTNMLSIHLPMSRLSKFARQNGGVVLGSETVEEFADTNAVLLDATDLFPRGCVELHGVRTFGYKRVDKAIMIAAAVTSKVGGPLVAVFSQVLEQMKAELPEVKITSFENNTGITAQATGLPVYIGTRALLKAHNIAVPAQDFEGELAKKKQYPVFVAIGSALAAMLIISYKPDKQRREELHRLVGHGCALLVSTTDGNISAPMIASLYGLDPSSVQIVAPDIGEEFRRRTNNVQPKVSASMATKGRFSSFSRILCRCMEYSSLLPTLVTLQTAAVFIGFALVVFLTCFAGIGSVSPVLMFIYELLWTAIILMLPKSKNR